MQRNTVHHFAVLAISGKATAYEVDKESWSLGCIFLEQAICCAALSVVDQQ